jgi:ribonuclease-3
LEAVLGAIYMDGGWDAACAVIMRLLGDRIAEASMGPGGQDYKTRLQELATRRFTELPRYTVTDDGPDHAKRFYADVRLGGELMGKGEGRSKKQAEAAAARAAWERLRNELAEEDDNA